MKGGVGVMNKIDQDKMEMKVGNMCDEMLVIIWGLICAL